MPSGKDLPPLVQDAVIQGVATLSTDGVRQRVQLCGAVPDALGEALVAAQKGKQRAQVAQQIKRHNALVAGTQAPANRGDTFVPVPRLGYRSRQGPNQGELLLLERDAVLETVDLNPLAQPVALAVFTLAEQGTQWTPYLDGQKLRVGRGDDLQLALERAPARRAQRDREAPGRRSVGRTQRRPRRVCDGLQAGAGHDDGAADSDGVGVGLRA